MKKYKDILKKIFIKIILVMYVRKFLTLQGHFPISNSSRITINTLIYFGTDKKSFTKLKISY